jgi:hypothetical protein
MGGLLAYLRPSHRGKVGRDEDMVASLNTELTEEYLDTRLWRSQRTVHIRNVYRSVIRRVRYRGDRTTVCTREVMMPCSISINALDH